MKTSQLLLALLLSASLVACGEKKAPEAPAEAPAESVAPPVPMAPEEGVAGHVEGLTPEHAAPAADGVAEDGHALYAAKCTSCHGQMGEGVGKNPKLAGLKVADIKAKVADYRAGKQMGAQTAVMAATAKTLTDAQIDALATYIGE